MKTAHIVSLLIAERDRLNPVIEIRGAPAKRGPGRPPKSATATPTAVPAPAKKARKKRTFTPEQRAAQGEKMRAFWKAKKKAK